MIKKIAFLGMGLMGSRMSLRLLKAGFDVAVWNRTPQAIEPLVALGAQPLHIQNMGDVDVIALCLADDDAVQSVYNNIEPYLKPHQVIIDFSSLSVAKTQALAQQAALKQVQWVDAPVSGGVQGAQEGTLIVFAGGEHAVVDKLAPIFNAVAQRYTYMGKVGTGQVTKICNQLIVAASSQLISESVALAQAAGVDATQLAAALANGFADSKPLQILMPRMATASFTPVQWKCQTLSKDLNNALQLARQVNVTLPVTALAQQRYKQHLQAGYAEQDLSTLILQHDFQHH